MWEPRTVWPDPSTPLGADLHRFRKEATFGVCDTGRYLCRYFVRGEGPAVVFIHGMADRACSFVPVIEHIAGEFACVAYELAEGRVDRARVSHYRHADFVADLFALLDHLKLERADVVGSSFGTTVALAAMHARPQRLRRAVLQGGFARRPLTLWERGLALMARYWPGRLRRLPLRGYGLRTVDYPAFAHSPPEVWDFFVANHSESLTRSVARRALLLHRLDLRPLLPAIRQPVLVLSGGCDTLVPREAEDELLRGLPNARRVECPACGHYPHYTHPDWVAEQIRAFLREED